MVGWLADRLSADTEPCSAQRGMLLTWRKQSAKPEYGILPAASGFIFWMRVLTKSNGSEQAEAKKPAIIDAVTVIGMPRRLVCSFSISLACTGG